MKERSHFSLFKKKNKSPGLDLPFNPEAVLCHDLFKEQKINFITGDNTEKIYKSMSKLRPEDMVCAVCICDDPRGGKEYNFSVAPKSYYDENQSVLKHPNVGLAVNLDRARKGNKVQFVLNFTLSQSNEGNEVKINERYVHVDMRKKGVMKMCSLSLLMQLANKVANLTVTSQAQHIATYKFVTGTEEGFPKGPVPSVIVSNTVQNIMANQAKDADNIKKILQRDYKIDFGGTSPKSGKRL